MSGKKSKNNKAPTSSTGSGVPSSSTGKRAAAGDSSAWTQSNTEAEQQQQQPPLPPSTGYLISCDVPTKQFIQYLNELKPIDKKFIIQDLDATHLLIKRKAKDEITRKVDEWLDENVYSAVEKVGEDFDVS